MARKDYLTVMAAKAGKVYPLRPGGEVAGRQSGGVEPGWFPMQAWVFLPGITGQETTYRCGPTDGCFHWLGLVVGCLVWSVALQILTFRPLPIKPHVIIIGKR